MRKMGARFAGKYVLMKPIKYNKGGRSFECRFTPERFDCQSLGLVQ